MQRFVHIACVSAALALTPLRDAGAQDAGDISIVSVLAMATDEAEQAPNEDDRIDLRLWVARSMMMTGQADAFGTYVFDALNAFQSRAALRAEQNEIAKSNLETEAKARQALLAGEVEQAWAFLRQCRRQWLSPRCDPALTQGALGHALFIGWEVEAGRLAAAWQRLTTTNWPPELRARMLIKVGAYVAAGDRNKLLELRQLAEAAGATFDSCLMKEPLLKSLGNAAKLRKLACDGQVNAALDIARAQRGSRIRTDAFTLIAEGMAGAFGLSGEPSLIDVTLAGPPGQLLRP